MSGIPGPPPPCPLCPPVCVLARLGPGATSNVPATTPDLWEMLPGSFKVTPLPRSLLSPSLSPLSLLHLLGTQDHVRTERVTLFALRALAIWTVPSYGQEKAERSPGEVSTSIVQLRGGKAGIPPWACGAPHRRPSTPPASPWRGRCCRKGEGQGSRSLPRELWPCHALSGPYCPCKAPVTGLLWGPNGA